MSDDEKSDTSESESLDALRLMIRMLQARRGVTSEGMADFLAAELYEACDEDAGRAAGKVHLIGLKRKAKPPSGSS